jgi:hypothetical protein
MSCYNNRYYIKVPYYPCPKIVCCPSPNPACCPSPKPACCPSPKPCKSESMYENCCYKNNNSCYEKNNCCYENKCCSVSCCIYPTITNLCCLLKKYSEMTRNIFPTNSCFETTCNGVFNRDFGISYGLYSSTACNDNTCGNIDIEQLNCQIENDYIQGCEIHCPSTCLSNGTQIHQDIKIIDKSKLKIVFVFWYKRCNKYNYDIYYGEYNCARCCDEQICVKLCYYNSTYGNSCNSCHAESDAIKIATQIVL